MPGTRWVARLPGTAHVPMCVAGAGLACLVRWHPALFGVMLAGQARSATGSVEACHEAINDGEGLVHQWRVTQLTRLGSPSRWRRSRPIAWSVRTIKNPDFPSGQRRAVPVPATTPAGDAARQQFSADSAGVLLGRSLRSCRARHGFGAGQPTRLPRHRPPRRRAITPFM